MKTWKLTALIFVFGISVNLPKAQAISNLKTEINPSESKSLVSASENQIQELNKIALNDIYWGPDRDFYIQMPGSIQQNELRKLMSWSDITQTLYIIAHTDLSVKLPYLSAEQVKKILRTSMREQMTTTGNIVRSTNLEIAGYPGLELLVQHSNDTIGQYQGFIVKGRMYFIGAITQGELTTEAVNFFDSFGVYPERLR